MWAPALPTDAPRSFARDARLSPPCAAPCPSSTRARPRRPGPRRDPDPLRGPVGRDARRRAGATLWSVQAERLQRRGVHARRGAPSAGRARLPAHLPPPRQHRHHVGLPRAAARRPQARSAGVRGRGAGRAVGADLRAVRRPDGAQAAARRRAHDGRAGAACRARSLRPDRRRSMGVRLRLPPMSEDGRGRAGAARVPKGHRGRQGGASSANEAARAGRAPAIWTTDRAVAPAAHNPVAARAVLCLDGACRDGRRRPARTSTVALSWRRRCAGDAPRCADAGKPRAPRPPVAAQPRSRRSSARSRPRRERGADVRRTRSCPG